MKLSSAENGIYLEFQVEAPDGVKKRMPTWNACEPWMRALLGFSMPSTHENKASSMQVARASESMREANVSGS